LECEINIGAHAFAVKRLLARQRVEKSPRHEPRQDARRGFVPRGRLLGVCSGQHADDAPCRFLNRVVVFAAGDALQPAEVDARTVVEIYGELEVRLDV
jgi:hypothetical protein